MKACFALLVLASASVTTSAVAGVCDRATGGAGQSTAASPGFDGLGFNPALNAISTNGQNMNGVQVNSLNGNGAPVNGAPVNGAPVNGAPVNGAKAVVFDLVALARKPLGMPE